MHNTFFRFVTYTLAFIALQFWASAKTHAQELLQPAPYARHITVLDNINLGEINAIFQSENGHIWLGSNEGLIRFDGFNAKRFAHNSNDQNGLHHNRVFGIIEDNQNNLWISTYGGGLAKYSPHNGQFKKIDLRINPSDPKPTNMLYNLSIDSHNTLWIGSAEGIKRVDIATEKAIALPKALAALPQELISSVFIDDRQHLWFNSNYKGLFWFDQHTLRQFAHDPKNPDSISSNSIRDIHQDPQGNIWISSARALHQFDRQKHTFTTHHPKNHDELNDFDSDIFAIQSDGEGRLWLGTVNNGVHYFTPSLQQFTPVSGKRDLDKQFRRNRVNKIIKVADGSLWFATAQGIILLPKTALRFNYLSNSSATLKVNDIQILTPNRLTFLASFKRFDLNLNTFSSTQRMAHLKRPYRMAKDSDENLWFATIGDGLQGLSATSQSLEPSLLPSQLADDPGLLGIFDTFVDSKDRIWLLTLPHLPQYAGGVARYFADTKQLTRIATQPGFSDIIEFDDNQLLLSSATHGLFWLNSETAKILPWQPKLTSPPQHITTLFKDRQGRVWLGTQSQGLGLYDTNTQSVTFYTIEQGLLSNNIVTIMQDNEQNLWLGSTIGLTRFTPDNGTVLTIEKQDGLLFSTFYKRTAVINGNGQMVMGTNSGLVLFDPQDFSANQQSSKVVINDFKLFNQSVKLSSKHNPTVLKNPIEFSQQISLSHKDYIFSFHFTAAEYLRPNKIRFAYKMQGLNEQWLYTDAANRVANYTTLPAGDYEFRVKASNTEGQWNDSYTSIKVTVKPPWWLTWQAYLSYFILIAASIYLFVRQHTAKLIKQAKVLEQNVAKRTKELQQSRDQLALQSQTVSDLLAQKQKLFASVSHEFRTPLTLILSPVEQLLSRYASHSFGHELKLIKRSARRLLRMVEQLLEFAKLEQNTDHKTEHVSLEQTLSLITSSFAPLLKSKQLGLSVEPFENVTLQVISDSLNKILINILSNAIKYTPQGGQITVLITHRDTRIDITVTDTGIGIASNDQQTIFQRFNRATHDHGEIIPGAGIGLALVKELVEANQGQISLTSELGQGSTFVVNLPTNSPLTDEHDNQQNDSPQMSEQPIELEIDSITALAEPPIDDSKQASLNTHKTVLIIDDNADMRTLLHNQLSEHYHCMQAQNGQVGLDIAREHLPDLVISDVMMPVMDGYQLTQLLKADALTSHIPIILLTAKGSVESRIKGLQLVVDDYLAKPFNLDELLLRIHNTLTIRDIVRKRFAQVMQGSIVKPQLEQMGLNTQDQLFLDKVNQYLDKHYGDPELQAKSLYTVLAVSEKQLQRKLKALYDLSFPELVSNFRLNKAAELLDNGYRGSEVYYNVGFSSHSYFTRCFKAKFGKTPKAYQQNVDDKSV